MRKSDIRKMPKYFDRYIALAEDLPIVASLELSLRELEEAPVDLWRQLGDKVYHPGKWTIKDILQHFIDTERVFTYRITAIARGDKQKMIPYDEDLFATNALANRRSLDDLVSELIFVRKATILLYQSFTSEMLLEEGRGFGGAFYDPLSLGFMLAGHQRWHFRVLTERYYPLLIA